MPDLRLAPDRFLSLEDDRAKAVAVLDKAQGRGFGAALDAYWSLTPELEPNLARGHLHRQLCEREAGASLWREVQQRCGTPQSAVLDVGCGLGGLLAAAAKSGHKAVGLDVAFRWTLIARLLLEEAAVEAVVVCANAEYPPFRPKTFDLAVANDLIEHVTDPPTAVAGAARAASSLYLASTHRFSLAPEPHVRLFGVGWLPRRMQSSYVKMRRGHAYDRVRPVTAGELSERVTAAGLSPGEVFAAPVFAGHLGFRARTVLRMLERSPRFAPRIGVIGR
ncbi:MAG: methyltransferase domain-containing protein [Bryobacterales bacterium]